MTLLCRGGLPDLEDAAGLLKFCFKAEEDCERFNKALQTLGCQIMAAPATAVAAVGGGGGAAAALPVATATPAAVATASVLGPAAGTAMKALLGAKLEAAGGKTVATAEALAGKKYVAVYFSAHWCPPCRAFTPQLIEWHKKHAPGLGCEIVFASSDKDSAGFKEYFGSMPWLAIPFKE